MSKTCLNCGREISGEGKNKVFCDDCFSIMSSFLRRLPKSNEPAMTVYERTKPNFPNMGISDRAAVYLEKCCKRYDEGMRSSQPTPAPANVDDGDYPDPISLPRRRRPAPMRDTPHASDTSYVSGLRYDINDDSFNDKNNGGDASSTQKFSYTERTPSYEEYQYREYSEAAAKVAAEEAAREASSRAGVGRQPERQQQRRRFNEYDNSGSGVDIPADTENNDTYDETSQAESGDETKRRLYLILAAAAAAVILFAILAFSGLLTGSRKPNIPVGGSGSDNVSDDINNGAVVLPTDSDSTDAPETTAGPATTESPTVDPATCLHQWTAATCTEASVCTICGTVNGAPLGHAFSAPTCTEHGKCMRCGEVNTADTLAAHDYAPATCTDPQKCRMCGATTGSALGHTFSAPTCSEHGKCTRCGAINNNDKLAAHDYADATCTEAQKCKVCGATNGEPLGHDYTGAPTFVWNREDYTCSVTLVCTRDESHTMDGGAATVTHETTTPATCTTAGVETYTATATVNGTTYMWSEKLTRKIPTTNHQFPYGSLECSVCGTSALQAGEFHGIGFASEGVEYRHSDVFVTVLDYTRESGLTFIQDNHGDTGCEEGYIRLVVKSGDTIKVLEPIFKDSDDRGSGIDAKHAKTHTVEFNIEAGDEPLFFEYYGDGNAPDGASNFWDEEKHDNSLYWKA